MSDSDDCIPELDSSDESDDEQADKPGQQVQQVQEESGQADQQAEDDSAHKRPARRQDWETIGIWDPHSESEQFIRDEILRIANEKMDLGGITQVRHLKSSETDLGLWKLRDQVVTQEGTTKLIRYRCPLSVRCKCNALLKIVYGPSQTTMLQSEMHDAASHAPGKDTSKFLTWQQKNEVV